MLSAKLVKKLCLSANYQWLSKWKDILQGFLQGSILTLDLFNYFS